MDSGGRRVEPTRQTTAQAEEVLRRNTDCVYFLASSLTCKKGSECEYRHSEGARFNPRDCWYWLNGNCSNPKCCFRHPPLDWLSEDPEAVTDPAEPPPSSGFSTAVQVAHGPASYNINRQSVPCYFFQKGYCLKGDKCAFMHGQQLPAVTQKQQATVISASPLELPSALTSDKRVPKECSHQNTHTVDAAKASENFPSPAKPAIQAEKIPNNGFVSQKSVNPLYDEFYYELPRFEYSNFSLDSGNPVSQPQGHQFQSVDEHLQDGKEADELLTESPPGFDVLVNNHTQDSDYFKNEDEYTGARVQTRRNLNFEDFNYPHSKYDLYPRLEANHYNDISKYDIYMSLHGCEKQKRPFERVLERPSVIEKRKLGEECYDELDRFDLRHQLLKRRRVNGSVSNRTLDCFGNHVQNDRWYTEEDRSHVPYSQRDHQLLPRERSIDSRLKSRIAVPTRSSPDQPANLSSEMDTVGERYQRRSSRARLMNYQDRSHDRMQRRLHDNSSSNPRRSGWQTFRNNLADASDFAGPKSLAELKGAKVKKEIVEAKNDKIDADGDVYSSASVVVFSDGQCQHSSKADNGGNNGECHYETVVGEDVGEDEGEDDTYLEEEDDD